MNKSNINEAVIENEKEWRRYMIKRLDKIDNDFNIFKIKAYGFMTVVTAIMNLALEFFKHK